MNIDLITVGKIKEKYFTQAVEEYQKRLSRFVKFTITEIPDEKIPDNASEKEKSQILKKEGEIYGGYINCIHNGSDRLVDNVGCVQYFYKEKIHLVLGVVFEY